MKLKSLLDYKGKIEPMTKEQSETFLMCCMSEQQVGPDMPEDKEEPQFTAFQILSKRLKWAGIDTSFWTQLFLSTLCGSPGNCVLYAYACADIYFKNGKRKVTMSDLANNFPMGFSTEEGLQACCEAQKRPTKELDNGYDSLEYWQAD